MTVSRGQSLIIVTKIVFIWALTSPLIIGFKNNHAQMLTSIRRNKALEKHMYTLEVEGMVYEFKTKIDRETHIICILQALQCCHFSNSSLPGIHFI